MRFEQLDNLIKRYNDTLYLRKLVGDHHRAKQLKQFLAVINHDPGYVLSSSEEYKLAVLLLSMKNTLPLIKEFKQLFTGSKVFFKLLDFLMQFNLIHEGNFSEIHLPHAYQITQLYQLLCKGVLEPAKITHQTIKTVSLLIKSCPLTDEVEAGFEILARNNLLYDSVLLLLEKKATCYLAFVNTLEELERANQLNAESLTVLSHYESWSFLSLAKLLSILQQSKLAISPNLLLFISKYQPIAEVSAICELIVASNSDLLTPAYLEVILTKVCYRQVILDTLILLIKKQLLNPSALDKVLSENLIVYAKLFKLFAEANLLDQAMIDKLSRKKISPFVVYETTIYLKQIKLLNDTTRSLIFSSQAHLRLKTITSIIGNSINYDKDLLTRLLKLSSNYLPRFITIINDLKKHNQISGSTVSQVLDKLNNKLAEPQEEYFFIKKDNAGLTFQSETRPLELYIEHDPMTIPLSGGRATIYQAHNLPNHSKSYLVKKLNQENDEALPTEAKKDTKYARFFGRESYFFKDNQSNRWYVISEWQPGLSLDRVIKKGLLNQLSFDYRLQSIIPTLEDLTRLHAQFRIHGDIKCQNCILDRNARQLKLIDFGSTRKVKLKKYEIPLTSQYLDDTLFSSYMPTNHFSFCDDIYALGVVIAFMFPEIYSMPPYQRYNNVQPQKSVELLSVKEQAVYHLVASMTHPVRKSRCTSKIALNYITAIMNAQNALESSNLLEILESTLCKPEYTVEEIMLDRAMNC